MQPPATLNRDGEASAILHQPTMIPTTISGEPSGDRREAKLTGPADPPKTEQAGGRKFPARRLISSEDKKGGFASIFGHDADSMLHVWIGKEDIKAITKAARSASLKFLSAMDAIRLDGGDTD
ncbi:hypothetical protein ACLB2K_066744 [Fragaria x ananassa]